MKKMLFLAASFAALLVLSGCAPERLPAEDIEVPEEPGINLPVDQFEP